MPVVLSQEAPWRGAIGLTYQHIHEDGLNTTQGRVDIGTSDTQILVLDGEYAVTPRWTVFGALPFIRKRYNGSLPHHPDELDLPHVHEEFLDDGRYHSSFQDLTLGFRYSATGDRIVVEPFVFLTRPVSNYSAFAHAAVGQNLNKFDAGVTLTYLPPLSDFYYSLTISRVFVDGVLGVNVDHWRFEGELGYFLSPSLSVKGLVFARQGNGLKFPDDFPPPRNDERWHAHEKLLAREYIVAGAGVDWVFSQRDRLSVSALRTSRSELVHIIDYGITVRITRAF